MPARSPSALLTAWPSVMTLSARGKYNDAIEMHCMGSKTGCDMTGLAETKDARSTANKATVVFIIGAALIGGGAAMYFLAPKGDEVAPMAESPEQSSFYLTPSVSPDSVGAVLGGSF